MRLETRITVRYSEKKIVSETKNNPKKKVLGYVNRRLKVKSAVPDLCVDEERKIKTDRPT